MDINQKCMCKFKIYFQKTHRGTSSPICELVNQSVKRVGRLVGWSVGCSAQPSGLCTLPPNPKVFGIYCKPVLLIIRSFTAVNIVSFLTPGCVLHNNLPLSFNMGWTFLVGLLVYDVYSFMTYLHFKRNSGAQLKQLSIFWLFYQNLRENPKPKTTIFVFTLKL